MQQPTTLLKPPSLPSPTSPKLSTDPNKPHAGRLSDKIARFDRLGGVPAPKGGLGLGAPPPPVSIGRNMSQNLELWGSKVEHQPNRQSVSRSGSLKMPRTSLDGKVEPTSPSSLGQFDTLPTSTRPRTPSNFSLHSNSDRGTFLSPNITGESSPSYGRHGSTRSVSPVPSVGSASGAQGDSLTVAAVSNLPVSPSLRPQDAASSIATDMDLSSNRTGLTVQTPVVSTTVSVLSSPTSDVSNGLPDVSRGRAGTVTVGDALTSGPAMSPPVESLVSREKSRSMSPHPRPSTPSYVAQVLMRDSPNEDRPRPSTPSYVAQAASYFPPARSSRRQSSIYLPPSYGSSPPLSSPPRDSDPPVTESGELAAPALSAEAGDTISPLPSTPPRSSVIPLNRLIASGPRADDVPSTRASMDTAYFSVENDHDFVFLAPNETMTDVWVDGQRVVLQDNLGSETKVRTLPHGFLDASPSPVPAHSADKTASVTESTPPSDTGSTAVVPTSSKGSTPVPRTQSPLARTSSILSSARARVLSSASTATNSTGRKPRPKSMLIPGKWISSDDEDEEEEEGESEGGKGWARIVVASRAR
ncbi:hypothetical protein BS47DRAFT_387244 [Hydnum rufescens UP504]|uniref:Uncharacterized protein n=1 Tax=Hydnum rufescens UP504 TaxID=1448309 RepID=A0A9P6AIU7_9AGAM|nr:hypothetical protein BS47DRAFT_387244 [Hydnum rufescens UP504]